MSAFLVLAAGMIFGAFLAALGLVNRFDEALAPLDEDIAEETAD